MYFVLVLGIFLALQITAGSCGFTEFDLLNYMMVSHSAQYWRNRPLGVRNANVDSPLIVQAQLYLQRVEKIDYSGEIHFQIIYHLSWTDTRFNFSKNEDTNNFWKAKNSSEYITIRDISKIWVPDIITSTEREEHEFKLKALNAFIRLFYNGTVFFSQKLSVISDCHMKLNLFPFDKIVCHIQLTSYDDIIQEVQLQWASSDPVKFSDYFPHLLLLSLEEFEYKNGVSKISTGEYSTISVQLQFSRIFRFYFLKYYLPVCIILLISWIPFWLGRVLILRIYIAMATVIFLGWYIISQPHELLVPYLTALDVWRGINFMFVLLAACESVFISHMIKSNTPRIKRTHPDENEKYKMLPCKNCPHKKKYLEVDDEKMDLDLEIMKLRANFKLCFINVAKEVEIIDSVAKLFFPSAYIIFIFFYTLKC